MKLISLSFDNFFSFGEEQELVFSDSLKRLKDDPRFGTLPNAVSVSLASVILGANGSGKTNSLKAISFLTWFVSSSSRDLDEGEKIPNNKFKFIHDNDAPTNFRIIFEQKGLAYSYCLTISPSYSRVLYEEISRLNFKTNRYTYLIKREYDENSGSYLLSKKGLTVSVRALKEFLRPNCSIISASKKLSETGLEDVVEAFSHVYNNVSATGRESTEAGDLGEATYVFQSDERYKSMVNDLIVDLDLGISNLEFRKVKYKSLPESVIQALKQEFDDFDENEGHLTLVSALHSVGDDTFELPILMESGGTKGLFCILQHIIPALIHGGVAVIDELELGLHPYMVEKIIKLFLEPGTNPNRAQLIATTHSANVLEHLDSRQVLFVEKDEETLQSEVWRLCDIKGVLPRDNFFRSYMSGKYGAVPKV